MFLVFRAVVGDGKPAFTEVTVSNALLEKD